MGAFTLYLIYLHFRLEHRLSPFEIGLVPLVNQKTIPKLVADINALAVMFGALAGLLIE